MKKNDGVLPDTNVLLRYLLRDHKDRFTKARDFFEGVRSGATPAVIMESVVIECVYVLEKYYQVPRGEIARVLSELLHYKGIQNKDREVMLTALALFRDKKIAIVDCLLIARHREENCRIITFAKAIQKELHDS